MGSDVYDYGQEHVGDIEDGLPWADGTFDIAVANHSLQCLSWIGVEHALAELHRVLKVDGHLRVLVPNIMRAVVAFTDGDDSWPGFVAISEPWSATRKFAHYLTWGGSNRTCFTRGSLIEAFQRAGFVVDGTTLFGAITELDSRRDESLLLEGVKR